MFSSNMYEKYNQKTIQKSCDTKNNGEITSPEQIEIHHTSGIIPFCV